MSAPQDSHNDAEAKDTPARGGVSGWLIPRAPVLVVLALAIAFAGSWRSEQVRTWMIDQLGPHNLFELDEALSDPDAKVAARACHQLLAREGGEFSPEAKQRLLERPAVATRCFEGLARTSESVASSRWNSVAGQLSEIWLRESMQSEGDRCLHIEAARRSLQAAELDASYPMLRCAILARQQGARECCVEQLGGQETLSALLEEPGHAPLTPARGDFEALVTSAFGEPNSESEPEPESEPDAEPDAEPESELESEVELRDWVVGVGCRLHLEEPGERIIVAAFRPVIEAPGCAPTETPGVAYYSAESWEDLCTELYPHLREHQQASPREAICGSLALTSIAGAVEGGRHQVQKAIAGARPKVRDDAEQFEFGDVNSGRGITNRRQVRREMGPRAAEVTRELFQSMSNQGLR